MDNLSLDDTSLKLALQDIHKVNKLLGGHSITLKALDIELKKQPLKQHIILDVGCGAGSMLREVADFCRKRNYNVSLIGVDFNLKSIEQAQNSSNDYPEIKYELLDVLDSKFEALNTDFLLCTLTLHHFTDNEIVSFLKRFQKITNKKIIINDLQRSKLAYLLFWGFSRIFLKSRIAKVDGLISIKSSFIKDDIKHYSETANISSQVQWKWAFRYLWTINTTKPIH